MSENKKLIIYIEKVVIQFNKAIELKTENKDYDFGFKIASQIAIDSLNRIKKILLNRKAVADV